MKIDLFWIYLKLIFFIFTSWSCALTQDYKSYLLNDFLELNTPMLGYKSILETDLEFLVNWQEKYPRTQPKIDYVSLLKRVSDINASKYNCTLQQVACSFPRNKTIYINHLFFKQPRLLRIAVLLHEVWHIESGRGHHNLSPKFKTFNFTTPYELELNFLNEVFLTGDRFIQMDLEMKSMIMKSIAKKIVIDKSRMD